MKSMDRIQELDVFKIICKEFQEYKLNNEFINLTVAAVCTHEHAFAQRISKEKFMQWIENAWNTGEGQRRVYNMEIEGGVMNVYGTVSAFAAHLDLFGVREGYLTTQEIQNPNNE